MAAILPCKKTKNNYFCQMPFTNQKLFHVQDN